MMLRVGMALLFIGQNKSITIKLIISFLSSIMKKTTTLAVLLAFSFYTAVAQDYLMSSSLTNITTCEGFFLDSGGGSGNYSSNQDFTTTICPDGVNGTHIQLVFSPPDLAFGDDLCFFDGTNTNAPPLGCVSDFNNGAAFIIQATATNGSGCVTVDFHSNFIFNGDGWSADINCIASCQLIKSVVVSTDPLIVPVDTGWIDICPGERVFFQGMGEYPQNNDMYFQSDALSTFEWDFGDGTSSIGPDASHVFDEPGGYIVDLKITDQIGCQNTNFIKQRVRVAPKPHFELGVWDETVCSGDTVNLNAMVNTSDDEHTVSVMPGEASFQTGGIRSDSLPIARWRWGFLFYHYFFCRFCSGANIGKHQ